MTEEGVSKRGLRGCLGYCEDPTCPIKANLAELLRLTANTSPMVQGRLREKVLELSTQIMMLCVNWKRTLRELDEERHKSIWRRIMEAITGWADLGI